VRVPSESEATNFAKVFRFTTAVSISPDTTA